MSELNLSLYKLAEGGDLLELFEMRAEAEAACSAIGIQDEALDDAMHNLAVVNEAIDTYMVALPAKVDGVRAVWKRIEVLIQEAADEVKFQSRRGQHLKADLDRLKDYCQRCMELIEWKPGKPRKLEGRSGYLLLKANGGRPAVEVTDESLVPGEMATVSIRMLASEWNRLRSSAVSLDVVCEVGPRVPSLSLIAEALSQPCPRCEGSGHVDFCGTPLPDGSSALSDCSECAGSGRRSVAGARLKPQGAHVECK